MEVINWSVAQLYFRFCGWLVSASIARGGTPRNFSSLSKPQRIVLRVLVLLATVDLFWLMQGCGFQSTADDWCYVPGLLHLFLSLLTIFCGIPLWLAVREEVRRDKEESYK